MFEFRIFGSEMGELTREWSPVEAESIRAARTWPLVEIANTVEARQRWHIVLRTAAPGPDQPALEPEQERGEVEFDGKRMTERWWSQARAGAQADVG